MLHFITDAPTMVVREALAFVPGASVDWAWEQDVRAGAPIWAEAMIDVTRPSEALQLALASLASAGYRIDGFHPREHTPGTALVSNPTFAMAAAAIDRTHGGGFGSPAPVYAR